MYKVVKYGAPWCGPCAMMDSLLKRAEFDFPEVIFENVDISKPENGCFLSDYKILAIPTIICFKDDEVVSKNTGGMSYQGLEELIKNLLTK